MTDDGTPALADALEAREGVTCVVGAGGKKTTLYTLAGRLDRAVLTATVRIPIFDPHVSRVAVTDDPVAALADTDPGDFPLGLVPAREGDSRYRGYDTGVVDDIAAAHDGPVLVKADGARTREFKAPTDDEPQLPDAADTVVPIASVHAVGKPLTDEFVHRPEEVAPIAGLEVGDVIAAEDVAKVVASPAGGLKGVPSGATAIPLLNKVDDADDLEVARTVARSITMRANVPKVVLAQLAEGRVVEVVEGT